MKVLTRTFDNVLVATHEYDDGTRETKRTHGNGLITEFEYNRSDNLKTDIKVFESDGITAIDDLTFSYAYDQNKNLTREDRLGLLSGTSFDAQYDAEDRVTQWDRDNLTESQDWTLSLVGDWESTTINGVAQSRSHNEVHELTGIGANSLSYDAKGNLVTDENDQEYIWDIDNHLSEALDTNDNTIATYGYDASGRRIYKTVGSTTTVFVCQGQQVLCEYDSSSATTSPSRTYVYGNYIDEPVYTIDDSDVGHYYHQNRQFNVIGMTNSSGAIVQLTAYTTYGEASHYDSLGVLQSSTIVDQPYEFTGRRKDNETELYYFRARYYSDAKGRFISRDPIGYVDGMSLYEYVKSNPMRYVDPFGLFGKYLGSSYFGWEYLSDPETAATYREALKSASAVHGSCAGADQSSYITVANVVSNISIEYLGAFPINEVSNEEQVGKGNIGVVGWKYLWQGEYSHTISFTCCDKCENGNTVKLSLTLLKQFGVKTGVKATVPYKNIYDYAKAIAQMIEGYEAIAKQKVGEKIEKIQFSSQK